MTENTEDEYVRNRIGMLLVGVVSASLALSGVASAAPAVASPRAFAGCNYVSSSYRPTLSIGSTGDAVNQVECLINYNSSYESWLNEDGVFDEKTARAVTYLQACNGIGGNGTVDARTWDKLYNPNRLCAF
ncbi:peptidoglycan-binding protein [Kitasatospora sp. NPDC059795]|uniref:peptidoglycan-binding domain-containing protein n=1 Tax=Kitasatospora sp. NPDC059795 TaxID=3346949 RepID=UPI00364D8754